MKQVITSPDLRRSGLQFTNKDNEHDAEIKKLKDLSEEHYEMSRDFLFPAVDNKIFEHQRQMRTDHRRQAALGPKLERFE